MTPIIVISQQFNELGFDFITRDAGDVADAWPVEKVATEAGLKGVTVFRGDAESGDFEDSGEVGFVNKGFGFIFLLVLLLFEGWWGFAFKKRGTVREGGLVVAAGGGDGGGGEGGESDGGDEFGFGEQRVNGWREDD